MRSYNGWTAAPDRNNIGVEPFVVAGVSFPAGVRSGPASVVLGYVAEQFHRRVEPLRDGWCWGFNYRQNRNSDNLSCHASGTAIDLNAPSHPNGKSGTFSVRQRGDIRKILAECEGVVRWGGDFNGTPDEMHFELVGSPAEVARVAKKLTAPDPEEDALTPSQEKKLDRIIDLLEALAAPRDAKKNDKDKTRISLGDVLTVVEKETR
ncbi:MAG: hypothetical protein JWO69_2057 [Thermoleophilia bacterium]|nr:hypothetical protein [Thermoleophilia bacterium]